MCKGLRSKKGLESLKNKKEKRRHRVRSLVRKRHHAEEEVNWRDQQRTGQDHKVHRKDNREPRKKTFKLVNVMFQFTFEQIPLDGSRVDWALETMCPLYPWSREAASMAGSRWHQARWRRAGKLEMCFGNRIDDVRCGLEVSFRQRKSQEWPLGSWMSPWKVPLPETGKTCKNNSFGNCEYRESQPLRWGVRC